VGFSPPAKESLQQFGAASSEDAAADFGAVVELWMIDHLKD
jgi:hypothetical protein